MPSYDGYTPLRVNAAIRNAERHGDSLSINNVVEQWYVDEPIGGGNTAVRATYGDAGTDVSLLKRDNLRPGGQATFEVTATNREVLPPGGITAMNFNRVSQQFGVQVRIELSPGLEFASNGPPPGDSSTPSVARSWTPVTNTQDGPVSGVVFRSSHSWPTLQVPVTITESPSLDELPLERRCLTATVEQAVPAFSLDLRKRANDVSQVCLGSQVVLSEGEISLWWLENCVGSQAYQCETGDDLKLLVRTGRSYLEPESVIIQIPDHSGRTDEGWATGRAKDHNATASGLSDAIAVNFRYPHDSTVKVPTSWSLTDVMPTQRPGSLVMFHGAPAKTRLIGLGDGSAAERTANLGGSDDPVPYALKFGGLGTYKVNLGVTMGNVGNDSATYTFHVGPISELAVQDGGHSPLLPSDRRAYTIEAVNNGPDEAPAVEITLTGVPKGAKAIPSDGTYREGSCQSGLCEAVWDLGRMSVSPDRQYRHLLPLPTLTLITPGRAPAEDIQAAITNTEDYSVEIDGTTQSTYYLDYIDDNNEAVIQGRTGTGEETLKGLRAQFYPDPPIAIVQWDGMEAVHGYPVSHYEVWSSPAPCQEPGADDAVVERRITIYLDRSVPTDVPTCYAVRPVNTQEVPGLWSEPVKTVSGPQGVPQLSIRGGSEVVEGEHAQFTIQAFPAPAAGEQLTVNYTVIQQGEFVAPGDLGQKTVSMHASGEAYIYVLTQDDRIDEAHGGVTVILDRGDGYELTSSRRASAVVMDDEKAAVNFASPAEATVSEGAGAHNVTVALDLAPHADLVIGYIVDGDADEGDDFRISGYSNGAGTVTAKAGKTSVDIPVRLVNDGVSEDTETLVLTLTSTDSDADYAVGFPRSYTLTITDDDGPGASFALAESEVDEGGGSKTVTVALLPAPTEDITVNYRVGGGTAQTDDYSVDGLSGGTGSKEVTAGTNSFAITVNISEDETAEGDETVVLTLLPSSAYTIGTNHQHTLTIQDNDLARASFASAASTAGEGDGTATVRVNLDQPAPPDGLTLRCGVGGEASPNVDFNVPNTMDVPGGQNYVDIPVSITDDGDNEAEETVVLTLRADTSYAVGDPVEHTLTIEDNDPTLGAFEAAEASVSETAGSQRAFITLEPVPHEDIVISYTINSSSTATEGVDYTINNSGTVEVRRGQSRVDVQIRIHNDAEVEGGETVILELTDGGGYELGSQTSHTLTILDDDAPTASFDTTSGEVNEDAGTHTVRVNLDRPASSDVTLNLGVSSPSGPIGAGGADYSVPSTVTVPAADTQVDIPVTILDDGNNEADERLVLTVEIGQGYSVGSVHEYTLTILDDDNAGYPVVVRDNPTTVVGGTPGHSEIWEGGGTINPTFFVTGGALPQGLDVLVEFVGGTATLNEDFRIVFWDHLTGPGDIFTLRAPANSADENGITWARFRFSAHRDGKREGNETAVFRILNGPGYTVKGPTEYTVTILNYD